MVANGSIVERMLQGTGIEDLITLHLTISNKEQYRVIVLLFIKACMSQGPMKTGESSAHYITMQWSQS